MDLIALAAALAIMGAIITGLLAVYQSTASPRSSLDRRLGSILGDAMGLEATAAGYEALRPRRAGLPIVGALFEAFSGKQDMAQELERADMRLTVSEFMALRVLVAIAVAAVPLLMMGITIVGILLMVVAGFVGYMLPKFYMRYAQGKRLRKLNNQLVEMLSMVANSLKAGFGVMQSLDLASKELEHPIATELRRTLQDINVGSSTEDALMALAKRSGSTDFDIVITAMLIQQSTGGNLAEILDTVGHTMRERIRIRGEITTLTTQQMLSGVIIGALPFFIGMALFMINPGYMSLLFTELAGNVMLAGAFMMECFGIFLIKRILAIEV
jgi:tight adherence protein B